jgi:nucleotide-binding universal stress UspA family protein
MYNPSHAHIILIPYDFTDRSDCALAHANAIARKAEDTITLLHVYNAESKSRAKKLGKSLKDLNDDLAAVAAANQTSSGLVTNYQLEEGSVYELIPELCKKMDARLLVMGTHGIQGLQHITGANILKVAVDSPVSDIIVQNRMPAAHGYKTIVFPIDSSRASKQKTFQAAGMARLFGGKVLIFAASESDEFVLQKVTLNIQFAQRTFTANGVPHTLSHEDPKGASFPKQVEAFATQNNADLIVIMTGQDRDLLDIFSKSPEESLVNNKAGIPVMCVDPLNAQFGAILGS